MRKVTQISKAHCIVQQGYLTEDEKFLISDVIDMLTSIIDHRVGHMLDNKPFKKQTQGVADFIDSIIDEIIDMLLDYFSEPIDYDEEMNPIANEQNLSVDQRRVMVEKHLLSVKAIISGIKVSSQEVDEFIADEDNLPLVLQQI